MIILEPHSGLANRMRVIASGVAYSKECKQLLVINWIKDAGLGCEFEDLFEPLEQKLYSSYFLKILRIVTGILDRKTPRLLSYFGTYFGDHKCRTLMWSKNTNDLSVNIIGRHKLNVMFTCNDFFLSKASFTFFKPKPNILLAIKKNKILLGAKCIGVHVRRSDNEASIANSPLNEFVKKIKEYLVIDSTTKFYLASDDQSVISDLKNVFGESIISRDKDFSRSSTTGITDALIDIYTLASCNLILGSYYSSFSEVAARIHSIPLFIISKPSDEK